jgi:hypothetical protein
MNVDDGDDGDDNTLMARDSGERGGGRRVGGASSLSRLLRAMESSSSLGGGRSSNLEDLMRLEAALFLEMDRESPNRFNYRAAGGQFYGRNSDSDDNNGVENAPGVDLFGLGGRRLSSIRAPNRFVRNRSGSNPPPGTSAHLDTVELLMRGVSEDEQLAMAIAMSMQDAQRQQQSQSTGGAVQEDLVESGAVVQNGGQSDNIRTSDEESSEESSSSESESSVEDSDSERNTDDGAASFSEDE